MTVHEKQLMGKWEDGSVISPAERPSVPEQGTEAKPMPDTAVYINVENVKVWMDFLMGPTSCLAHLVFGELHVLFHQPYKNKINKKKF